MPKMISARFALVVNSVERDTEDDDDELTFALEAVAFATLDIIRRFVSSSTSLRNCDLE